MPGDFSQEAYEQLRAAYAKETNTQIDAENEGVKVGGQEMTLETLPVDSPWKSKIENWEYPTGRSQYLDGKQDPAEILAIMRGAAQEQDDAEKLEEAKELVAEAEANEAEETVAETEELDDEDLGEMSDEEFEKFVADLLDEDDDAEENEEDEEEEFDGVADDEKLDEEETEEPVAEVEAEVEETEEEAKEETEEDEEYDPQAVADEISRLKDELENMRFVPTEEPKADENTDGEEEQ